MTHNDIYTKLIGIVDSSYDKLKELKEPEKCKTLDMYYGSSAVYNIQENKLEICDHDEQYISPPGLISGNKLFLYGIKQNSEKSCTHQNLLYQHRI